MTRRRIVLSPHLDDAVLSLGQHLAHTPGTVITVFAGVPEPGFVSDYDRSCGFESSHRAMRVRRAEDESALGLLDCFPVHWDFFDDQYAGPLTQAHVLDAAISKILNQDADVFVPLGLGHPDHRRLARTTLPLVEEGTLYVYEELPYRIMNPEVVVQRFDEIRAQGWDISSLTAPIPVGERAPKVAALARYVSQFGAAGDRELEPMFLCPERVWRIAR